MSVRRKIALDSKVNKEFWHLIKRECLGISGMFYLMHASCGEDKCYCGCCVSGHVCMEEVARSWPRWWSAVKAVPNAPNQEITLKSHTHTTSFLHRCHNPMEQALWRVSVVTEKR